LHPANDNAGPKMPWVRWGLTAIVAVTVALAWLATRG
jgi:hypothetical protein